MELLLDDIDQVQAMSLMVMPGDTTLSTLLSKEDYDFVAAEIKAKTGQGMLLFQKMRPLFISSQLEVMNAGAEMTLPLDLHLDAMAKEQGKVRLGIEKFEQQAAAVKAIPLTTQAEMLVEGLRMTDEEKAAKSTIEDMIEMYRAGELDSMLTMTDSDENMPDNFEEEFLIKRNKVMAENIAKYSSDQTTFNAVGAAHLGGDEGVIALLRKHGYTVRAIKTSFKEAVPDTDERPDGIDEEEAPEEIDETKGGK